MACEVFLGFLLVVNVGAYFLARHDKREARRKGDRTPERTFHMLALLGAGPGAMLAFASHRHKLRKTRFMVPFFLAGAGGAVLIGAWLSLLCQGLV